MIKIFRYLSKKEWTMILVSFIFILTQIWLDLKLPDYMSEVTRLSQTPGSRILDIWINGGYMLLCAFGSIVASIVVGYFAAKISASFSQRLRSLIFRQVESFSMEEVNYFSTSSLITRTTNDVNQVRMVIVMGLQMIIKAPITAVWAITKIYGKGFEWSVLTGIVILVLILMVTLLMILVMPKFKIMQSLTDNLTKVTRENLIGVRVVRAYNAEDYQQNKFEQANNELTNTQLFTNRAMTLMMPIMSLMMSGLPLAIYWIGAYLINAAEIMDKLNIFSNMVVFSSYAMQIIMSFMMLVMVFVIYPRASVSAKRINEVLELEPKIKDGHFRSKLSDVKGKVEFKNVTFKYPDAAEPVLEKISFVANPGETTAFIGSTGSGKSTLINLVPRFFDVTSGEVLINDINVKEYKLETLYNKLGYVPQNSVIFKGTIESNVTYGENNHNSDDFQLVKQAIEMAQAKSFVENMEDGYEANVAQDGTNLSGGQKQRLAIARAIYRKPEIYIFDDTFSALDYQTDRQLRSVLKEETRNITSLIVAQRIGTIMNADKIIVLDEGKIVGQGKHKELLEKCKVYREIAMSQLSEEELL